MKRRSFLVTTAAGSVGLGLGAFAESRSDGQKKAVKKGRKIFVYGGGMGKKFINYMISLTGKEKPRLCYLPTASADSPYSSVRWFKICSGLNAVPFVQEMFISSYQMKQDFEEILLSMDGIVVGGGNTLNMLAIWKVQGIDKILRKAWDQGIVLGGGSAGSLCWFEEGTTDSRPKELTKIECLGFLKGSHSPHYDAEKQRRPEYQKLIKSGKLKPGYAIDNHAGIYFEDNQVKKVVATDKNSKAYYVDLEGGKIKETVLKPDVILKMNK